MTSENDHSPNVASRNLNFNEPSPQTSAAFLSDNTNNQQSAVPALKMQERLKKKLQ